MKVRFSKMQGAGNDFVVFDGVRQSVRLDPARARRIADRHFGVGCDQVLLVERAQLPGSDFRYRIWNSDGGEVEQCGNGARCFARFVRDQGLTKKDEIRVETLSGVIVPRLEADGHVTVDMGRPQFEPASIPFDARGLEPDGGRWPLQIPGHQVMVAALSMGNPHAVQWIAEVDSAPVGSEGPLIECHARFPQRVNAGYAQIMGRGSLRLRVWERGAGETLACGTGACAAVVAGIRDGRLDETVRVETRGGHLTIRWRGGDNPVWMTGPAVTVFEGEIELEG